MIKPARPTPTARRLRLGDAALAQVRGGVAPALDSLSEMGEMESLRLQMEMDRRSK